MQKKHYSKKIMAMMLSTLLIAEPMGVVAPVVIVHAQEAEEENSETTIEVELTESNFPDEKFRSYLSDRYDADENGKINPNEITEIFLDGEEITSLKGIELFNNLTTLYCYDNELTSLDVSKNTSLEYLRCDNNELTSLDVSKNTKLKYLFCVNNELTSLDISKNTSLMQLCCGVNRLTSLDVSKNTSLKHLACSYNELMSLDVSKNTKLTNLYCNNVSDE